MAPATPMAAQDTTRTDLNRKRRNCRKLVTIKRK